MSYRNSESLHLGLIPDGNRRFAKRLLEEPWKGHELGSERLKVVFNWLKNIDVRTITFYSLSLENLEKRPKKEIEFIFLLIKKELQDVIQNKDNFVHKNKIKLMFFGNLEHVPHDIRGMMKKAEEITKKYSKYKINFAVAYGARQELIAACKKIAQMVKEGSIEPDSVTESMVRKSLLTNGAKDPDLIIRTGGEKRLSNFLLFQSAYSELAFIDTFWPEVSEKEFVDVVRDFRERERRFGK